MAELVYGIAELTTNSAQYGTVRDAAVIVEGDAIVWVGPSVAAPAADTATDVGGRAVLPGWVDAHTHLMFAGDRAEEFSRRMTGEQYAAGGISSTVAATRAASDDELRGRAAHLRRVARANGTTSMEIKTGYALDVHGEARLARLAQELSDDVTFLGAHVVPAGTDADDYVSLVTGQMLDAVRPYARWIDVFCERGAFDADQSAAVLEAGVRAGLGVRVHGNQLGHGEGVRLAIRFDAASVDHCNHLDESDIGALAATSTIATLLPACDVSTGQPFAPARRLLDAGARIALASNCNPGTSFTTSMAYCVSTAVLQMGLTVQEAVAAATLGGARALRRDTGPGRVGVVEPGARADLQALDAPSITHLAYRPGMALTWRVWSGGDASSGAAA